MKPKTKRTIIIVAAVVAVAIIIWLLVRKRGKSTEAIINRLNADDGIKSMIKTRLAYIESYAASANASEAWSVEKLQEKAKERGISYEQELVLEAIYSLVDSGSLDSAQGQSLIAQIL